MLGQGNFKVVELHSCLSEFDTISNRLDHQPLFEKRAGTPLPNPLLREELKPLIKAYLSFSGSLLNALFFCIPIHVDVDCKRYFFKTTLNKAWC